MMISQRRCFLIALATLAMPGRVFAAGSDITITSTSTGASGGANTSTFKSQALVTVNGTAPAGVTSVNVYFGSNQNGVQTFQVINGKWNGTITAPTNLGPQDVQDSSNAVDPKGAAQSAYKNVTITVK